MKTTLISFLISAIIAATSTDLFANKSTLNGSSDSLSNPLSPLLNQYLNLKDALVNSDANSAASAAGILLEQINNVKESSLQPNDQKAFSSLKSKLALDARHISEVKNLDHQREHFASLSSNMYLLAKKVKLTDKPVYQDYCPMKKSYWLSTEADIKNPYYGKQMLNCGDIKETLK
ncbi:MAG: hypothetical protein C5B52_00375 [Bacteroidetes bacterium]|nr:MAG: hypothetical protein C5B52_00375 [Bacteroidota bacterium]